MYRWRKIILFAGISLAVAGCPKGRTNFNQGRKAQNLQDYDAAFEYYQKALKSDPENTEYKIKFDQARFGAGETHTKKGLKLREQGDLENAASEFRKAAVMDPSSIAAEQELRKTLEMIDDRERAANAASESPPDNDEADLASAPPQLKPLSRAPINLKMSNDAKVVFDTIGKLAGLTVIYDPDFPARRISVELNDVTLEQALDIVCIESKAFSTPISENVILVIPDQAQKRRDYEEQFMRTFYLSNTAQAQDLTEIVTGLRQILDLKRIQQLNAQNAIVIRATPDQLALAEKFIKDIDKAKSEVIIQVEVLEARTDRMRDLGILPGQSASIAINPNSTTNTTNTNGSSTSTNATPGSVSLSQLTHLNQNDLVLTLPSATANFLLTDSTTRVIQNPEVRSLEGQPAKLNIGDRVPVATGSFQAGVGVGATGGAGFVNPLVNTQFQYIDVGVNVEVTPRVHPNRDVSLKLQVEVSSVSNNVTIGGIQQPVISQRKIAHEIRLKEGESSMLAGLITKSDMKTLNGWPGLAHIPILKHLFSDDNRSSDDDEILMILTPHIVRMPEWTKANLKASYAGSETNVQTRRASEMRAPLPQPPAASKPTNIQVAAETNTQAPLNSGQSGKAAQIRFEPRNLSLKTGQAMTVGIVVDNVSDLFSVPFLLQYNPAVISVEEVRHGGFLQAGDQEIAIVQKVDNEHGQAIISATRQPSTAGVNGTGIIMGIVIKGLAPGAGTLSIVQVSAKDSQQRPIQLVTTEATVQVEP
jgi:general secretion pathway protein D